MSTPEPTTPHLSPEVARAAEVYRAQLRATREAEDQGDDAEMAYERGEISDKECEEIQLYTVAVAREDLADAAVTLLDLLGFRD